MLGMSLVAFSACSGLVDVYDELPEEVTSQYPQLKITATTYDNWTYISLHQPEADPILLDIPQTLTGEWDGVTCYTRQQIKLGTTTEYTVTSLSTCSDR